MTAHEAIREWFREDPANRYLNPADKLAEITSRLRQLGFGESAIEGLRIRVGTAWMECLGVAVLILGCTGWETLVSAEKGDSTMALVVLGVVIAWNGSRRINYDRREAKALRLESPE